MTGSRDRSPVNAPNYNVLSSKFLVDSFSRHFYGRSLPKVTERAKFPRPTEIASSAKQKELDCKTHPSSRTKVALVIRRAEWKAVAQR
nr:hypothetical protein Itr_chr04CG20960 [Ipomoea trifida]